MGPTGPTSSWRPFWPALGPSGLLDFGRSSHMRHAIVHGYIVHAMILILYPLIDIFLSTRWSQAPDYTRCRQRSWPGLENNRILHLGRDSGRFHHLWPWLHVPYKLWAPQEMLQVLRRLGEGGQKSGLWNLLLCWWREEAGCDGGNF